MKKISRKMQIGVIGSADATEYKQGGGATEKMKKNAREIGFLLAKKGISVVTGGKGGIMEASAEGAKSAGGITIGVIKGAKRYTSNAFTDVEILTGMQADGLDELILVLMCDAVISLGGGAGTLQEISIAYRNKKPIISLSGTGGWSDKLSRKYLDKRNYFKIISVKSPKSAVKKAIELGMKSYV